MPTFNVRISRDITQHTEVIIEAESLDAVWEMDADDILAGEAHHWEDPGLPADNTAVFDVEEF